MILNKFSTIKKIVKEFKKPHSRFRNSDETTVIEDDVSILQQVTLGGTGNEKGDRHPKIRSGVLISTGAKVLGNIEIGMGAKIGANSVVLNDVAPHTTVVGVPAKAIGKPGTQTPSQTMNQNFFD